MATWTRGNVGICIPYTFGASWILLKTVLEQQTQQSGSPAVLVLTWVLPFINNKRKVQLGRLSINTQVSTKWNLTGIHPWNLRWFTWKSDPRKLGDSKRIWSETPSWLQPWILNSASDSKPNWAMIKNKHVLVISPFAGLLGGLNS